MAVATEREGRFSFNPKKTMPKSQATHTMHFISYANAKDSQAGLQHEPAIPCSSWFRTQRSRNVASAGSGKSKRIQKNVYFAVVGPLRPVWSHGCGKFRMEYQTTWPLNLKPTYAGQKTKELDMWQTGSQIEKECVKNNILITLLIALCKVSWNQQKHKLESDCRKYQQLSDRWHHPMAESERTKRFSWVKKLRKFINFSIQKSERSASIPITSWLDGNSVRLIFWVICGRDCSHVRLPLVKRLWPSIKYFLYSKANCCD